MVRLLSASSFAGWIRPRNSRPPSSAARPGWPRDDFPAFLIVSHLDLKIMGDPKRDQVLILTYTILPALFCPTIIVQALKRGFGGYPALYGASWYWWLKRASSPGTCGTFIEEGGLVAITRRASVTPTGRAARHRVGDRSIPEIPARTAMAGRDPAAQPA